MPGLIVDRVGGGSSKSGGQGNIIKTAGNAYGPSYILKDSDNESTQDHSVVLGTGNKDYGAYNYVVGDYCTLEEDTYDNATLGYGHLIKKGAYNNVIGGDRNTLFEGSFANLIAGMSNETLKEVTSNLIVGAYLKVLADNCLVGGSSNQVFFESFASVIGGQWHEVDSFCSAVFGEDHKLQNPDLWTGWNIVAGYLNEFSGRGNAVFGAHHTFTGDFCLIGGVGSDETKFGEKPVLVVGNGTMKNRKDLLNRSNALQILQSGLITADSLTKELIAAASGKALVTKEFMEEQVGSSKRLKNQILSAGNWALNEVTGFYEYAYNSTLITSGLQY